MVKNKSFGSLIRESRIKNGFGQRELAVKIGVAPSYLNDIEKEKRSAPKQIVIKKISKLLKININTLNDLAGISKGDVAPDIGEYIENNPKIIKSKNLIFGCTGTIGEKFPEEKIKSKIPELIKNIKYTQNKYIWMKVALSIMTTDTQPKIAMEECKIGSTTVKIYGVAKGSGMIQPNMATTLAYVFTDADISNDVLKKLLKKNIENTFNAISCDSDTSTNDMISIFSTGKAKNTLIKTINDKKIKSFDEALNSLLLNLAKRVVADGEGASKFITINVLNSKSEQDAKKIGFSIANSPLVKTAIAGEDPNWGRIIMAIGKSDVDINLNKLSIKFGDLVIVSKGKIHNQYNEVEAAKYMKGLDIKISVDIGNGKKSFTVYTMDLTNEYIKINSDYRS